MVRPHRRTRRATIEDVADAAGVSMATVSRALRGLPNVADATRERVAEVAAALDYQPDPAASRLAAGRTRTVTAVVPTFDSWYFATVVAGAEAVWSGAGYAVSVVVVPDDASRMRLLSDRTALERHTDGLLLVELPVSADQIDSLRRRGIAVATVGSMRSAHPSVGIDDEAVGALAALHLTELGHVRVGVIGGLRDDGRQVDVTALRLEGFEAGLREHALEPVRVHLGNVGVDRGQAAMAALLDGDDPPTAVFAMSDELAFGALMELRDRGLRAGSDVSLVGVDDHEFARVVALTTIRQRVADQGATAAQALIAAMDGSSASSTAETAPVIAPIELVVRATTGPPRP